MANILGSIQLEDREGGGRTMDNGHNGRLVVRMEVALNHVCLLTFSHFCVESVVF